jgi:hypothetical protein
MVRYSHLCLTAGTHREGFLPACLHSHLGCLDRQYKYTYTYYKKSIMAVARKYGNMQPFILYTLSTIKKE